MKKGYVISFIFAVFLLIAAPVVYASPQDPSLLKQGMTGDEVYKLQVKLYEYGYYGAAPDGSFGEQTRLAVQAFQLDNGLDADGVVGPSTLLALKDYKPAASRAGDGRRGQQLAAFARQYLGVPYVWAGRSPSGFDCSGFVYYVFSHFGIDLPRMADGQFAVGSQVSMRELQPGDLVFFSTYEPGPSHVGIYVGGGQFIHASSGAEEVTITALGKAYYMSRYLGARRIIR